MPATRHTLERDLELLMEQEENTQLKQQLGDAQRAQQMAQQAIRQNEALFADNQQKLNEADSCLLQHQLNIENLMAEQTALREEAQKAMENQAVQSQAELEEARRRQVLREDEIRRAEQQTAQEIAQQAVTEQQRVHLAQQEAERKDAITKLHKASQQAKEREHMVVREARQLLQQAERQHAQQMNEVRQSVSIDLQRSKQQVIEEATQAVNADRELQQKQLHEAEARHGEEMRACNNNFRLRNGRRML